MIEWQLIMLVSRSKQIVIVTLVAIVAVIAGTLAARFDLVGRRTVHVVVLAGVFTSIGLQIWRSRRKLRTGRTS
jgi:hypothetical protein